MRCYFVSLFFLVFSCSALTAQTPRKVLYSNQVWFTDVTRVSLGKGFSFYFEGVLRRREWFDHWNQWFIRPGVTYTKGRTAFTLGFAYFNIYQNEKPRSEYRPWQQVQYGFKTRYPLFTRWRLEQRFVEGLTNGERNGDYQFTNRLRIMLSTNIPLNRPSIENNTLYLYLSDEVMLNAGPHVVHNHFDQNRLSGGLGFNFNPKLNIALGYTHVFVQRNLPRTFEDNNIIQLTLNHQFSLSK